MDIYQIIASYIVPIIITGVISEIIRINIIGLLFDKINDPRLKWLALNGYVVAIACIVNIPVIMITFKFFDVWQYLIYIAITWLFSGKGYDLYKKFLEGK